MQRKLKIQSSMLWKLMHHVYMGYLSQSKYKVMQLELHSQIIRHQYRKIYSLNFKTTHLHTHTHTHTSARARKRNFSDFGKLSSFVVSLFLFGLVCPLPTSKSDATGLHGVTIDSSNVINISKNNHIPYPFNITK